MLDYNPKKRININDLVKILKTYKEKLTQNGIITLKELKRSIKTKIDVNIAITPKSLYGIDLNIA